MKKNYLLLAGLLLFLLWNVALASEEEGFIPGGLRPLGMGGAFAAVGDDQNAFLYNPAGLTQISRSRFSIGETTFGLNQDTLDILDFLQDNRDDLENYNDLEEARQEELTQEIVDKIAGLNGSIKEGIPLNFSYIRSDFAFGFLNQGDLNVKVSTGIIVPRLHVTVMEDVLFLASAARKMKVPIGDLSSGASLKYLMRWKMDEDRTVVELGAEDFEPELLSGDSFGLDLGGLWKINRQASVGLTIHDILATKIKYKDSDNNASAGSSKIKADVRLGGAYKPGWKWMPAFMDDLVLAADINHLIDGDYTFFKKIHLGGEVRFWKLLGVRGGFYQGYPSFGLGLRLAFFNLDYAFHGEELGEYAGQVPEWNHLLQVGLRF